ncbi:MAG TPA: hypothetical protein VJR23_13815 [Candidatus Acidoferrales bacterium]|nr:hypothetical protein [Candidatus Acidoferrales bacterium]
MRIAFNSKTAVLGLLTGFAVFFTVCAVHSSAQENSTPPDQQASVKAAQPAVESVSADPVPEMLDKGFHRLYGLDFRGAREEFLAYQKARPEDPMGKAAEAASYLFEEFNAKGILTSEFFLNDDKFLKGLDGDPRANANAPFMNANSAAREMAKEVLSANPRDTNAMLVLTMTDGMESDYDQVIERKQLPAVSLTRQAENEASALLAIDPNAKDAYVALGAGHYIIGCLPGIKRAFLWFGGIHGDKERGMEEMKYAVAHGHYLQPFAKILLALAYRREHEPDLARPLLADLTQEFPTNPLFAHELALLDNATCCKR